MPNEAKLLFCETDAFSLCTMIFHVPYSGVCIQSKYLNNFSHFLIETFSSEYFLSGDEDIMKIFPDPHLSVYLRYNGLSNLFFVTLGQATCLETCWGSNEVIFSPGSHEHFLQRCSRLNIFQVKHFVQQSNTFNFVPKSKKVDWDRKLFQKILLFI